MRIIYKYSLDITDTQIIQMSIGANILCVQFQGDQLCLWAMVDPHVARKGRQIHIVGTGHDCCYVSTAKHIGTVLQPDLPLVWHVFDGGPE